jgi:hypothetical protein
MTGALAAIRPDEWNLPLLVHVLGAMVLVGGLTTAVAFQYAGWRSDRDAAFGRVAFRALLFVALPAWFVMRAGADWIWRREGWDEAAEEPAWLGVGWITADLGGLLLVVSIILAAIGVRRARRGEQGRSALVRVSAVLVTLILLAYVIAVWAMTGKPD